ncbi:MAG: ShlB/FhaC/HecB family hemolysin secretion/activation protein, partial [Candidatus Margulisiibacteriota bacterium]
MTQKVLESISVKKIILLLLIIVTNGWPNKQFDQISRQIEIQNQQLKSGASSPNKKINIDSLNIEPKSQIFDFKNGLKPKKIQVMNNTLLTSAEIHYLVLPYINKLITNQTLMELIQAIQLEYIKRGYLTTRVIIDAKKTTHDQLILQTIEGKIRRIYSKQNNWQDKVKIWQLFPIKTNSIASTNELRIGIQNVNRLDSMEIKTRFEPGFNIGESNLYTEINQKDSPWSFYSSFTQPNAMKPIPSFLQITGDNLLGIFDQWKLSYSHLITNYTNHNSSSVELNIPIRRHLFNFKVENVQNNIYTNTFSANTEVNDTKNIKYSINDEFTLLNTERVKLKITPSLQIKKNKSLYSGVEITSQTSQQTLAGIQIQQHIPHILNLKSAVSFEKTMPWWNSQKDPVKINNDAVHYEFEKWHGSFQISQSYKLPLVENVGSLINLQFQKLNQITQPSEHGILGGWHSVKGFQAIPLFGENMIRLSIEKMLPLSQYKLPHSILDLNIQLRWHLDIGYLYRPYGVNITTINHSFA